MLWLRRKPPVVNEMTPTEVAKHIKSMSRRLDANQLMHCMVGMVSDRKDVTTADRSMLLLRLGGVVVASTPRPDK